MSSNTEDQAMSPYCADGEHNLYWEHLPNYPLDVRRCMRCPYFDTAAMKAELEAYVVEHESTLKAEYEEKTRKAVNQQTDWLKVNHEKELEEKVRQARVDSMYEVIGHLHVNDMPLSPKQHKSLLQYMDAEGISIRKPNTPNNGEQTDERI